MQLNRCIGWSQSLQGTHTQRPIFSWNGQNKNRKIQKLHVIVCQKILGKQDILKSEQSEFPFRWGHDDDDDEIKFNHESNQKGHLHLSR